MQLQYTIVQSNISFSILTLMVNYFLPIADPQPVTGDLESAVAVELNPWVEYEFRVVASNAIGTGDPSAPSRGVRTKEAGTFEPLLHLESRIIIIIIFFF